MRSILILDDEPLILMYLEEVVAEFGFTAASSSKVDDALRLVESATCDAAILDVNLGAGQDSLAVARALAAKGVPFAFATGYDDLTVQHDFADCPVLRKPFDIGQVEGVLRKLAAGNAADGSNAVT